MVTTPHAGASSARAPVRDPLGPLGAGNQPGTADVLNLIRKGAAKTRGDLVARTGLARSTVGSRVDALLEQGLVRERRGRRSSGGRPPGVLEFDPRAAVLLAADLDRDRARLAVTDLAGTTLACSCMPVDPSDRPPAVLDRLDARLRGLLSELGRTSGEVRGVGVAMPAQLAVGAERRGDAPRVGGWGGFSVSSWFAERHRAVVRVDCAASMSALGEHRIVWPAVEHLVFVNVGAEIACGIVSGGRITRGAQGIAGQIGHVRVSDGTICRCGNTGCLEAMASARAIAEQLAAHGVDASGPGDVLRLTQDEHPLAVRAARRAGCDLGAVLGTVVSLFAPDVIVIGGELGADCPPLLAGVRKGVFQLGHALATRDLRIAASGLGHDAALTGIAIATADEVLS